MPDAIVIVGASAAGLAAAETLRRGGYDRRLTLIGEEAHLPYDRPPLSKQVLAGDWEPSRTALRDASAYEQLDLDLRLGVTATALDLAYRRVELDHTEHLPYDRLIVATGVRPRRLAAGHELEGVHTLRTRDDAVRLRGELLDASRLLVVGAGFLGCEVAATARTLGLEVTLVDPLPVPLRRQLGARVGGLVAELQRDHGVSVRCETGVLALNGRRGRVTGAQLSDGTSLEADVVLVAIGSVPATEWLHGSGLVLEDGVVCDETCRAAPDVYAAGDVARWRHPLLAESMRIEHRINATSQGMCVARGILGSPTPCDAVPYFWTDQFDAKIQAYGCFPPDSHVTLLDGDPLERCFIARYEHAGRIVGVLGWNMPGKLAGVRSLVGQDASPQAQADVPASRFAR